MSAYALNCCRLALAAWLLIPGSLAARTTSEIRVDETRMRATFQSGGISISVPLVNSGATVATASLRIELVDSGDLVRTSAVRSLQVPPGTSWHSVVLTDNLPATEEARAERLWSRVRYQLSSNSGPPATSLVTLGAITPDLFALRVVYIANAMAGAGYRLRVHAMNPVTRRPVAGVAVSGTLAGDAGRGDTAAVPQTTNTDGEAVLRWPAAAFRDTHISSNIVIHGRKGAQEQATSIDVTFSPRYTFVVSTDKLLYQPGQSLHVRTLLFDATKHAVPATHVQFTLEDPESAMLFRTTSTTDRFGVASVDWQLPDALRLGDYPLTAKIEGVEDARWATGYSYVHVSRYDLPTFTVSVSPDRPFYLPGQDALLAVDASYLYGRAVSGGSVKLVREARRLWDYKTQAWLTEEQDVRTSELDAKGHTTIKVTLSDLSAQLDDQESPAFRDVTYAAYVTDPSTGRTEQRRVDVRVSRDPIHLWVSRARRIGSTVSFYVTASYPDGRAAQVSLQVGQEGAVGARMLRSLKTNRFGAARIRDLTLEGDPDQQAVEETEVVIEARDRQGAHATRRVPESWFSEQSVEITTDKTIYRPGEPVILTLRSREGAGIVVDAVRDRVTVWSARVALRGGRGFSVMPYREQFKGVITLVAYGVGASADSSSTTHRAVVYPHDTNLRVSIRPGRRTYAPGDHFSARVQVDGPAGVAAPSVLGVSIVDKAVEERARTDGQDRWRRSGFWNGGWWDDGARVGTLTKRDLARLDVSREIPADVDLAAEILLAAEWFDWDLDFEGYDFESVTAARFRKRIDQQVADLGALLRKAASLPANDQELAEVLKAAGLARDRLMDPWGTGFAFKYDLGVRDRIVTVISAGPDKQLGTPDDIFALRVSWNHFTPTGAALDRAVKNAHERSGVYVRDMVSLKAALRDAGIEIERLRDPWGVPYEFGFDVHGSYYRVLVRGARAHGRASWNDDVVWTSSIDYFEATRGELDKVYAAVVAEAGRLPRSDKDIDGALQRLGSNFRELRDPWGNAYFVDYSQSFEYGQELRYSANSSARPVQTVTQTFDRVTIMSAGPDGKRGTSDDFSLAMTALAVAEQAGRDKRPAPTSSTPVTSGSGTIEGVVTDETGGVLPGVSVLCQPEDGTARYTATSDAGGRFRLSELPSGMYRVQSVFQGFQTLTIRFVPVERGRVTSLDVTMAVVRVFETVQVEAASRSATIATESASVGSKQTRETPARPPALSEQIFTPRIREYFPETLYWTPSIATGPNGSATISARLADTITTWKMGVIASTETGEIGFGEAEIEAFQPFFVEHDPPKVLTAGDAIDLPVLVRNFLNESGRARVDLAHAPWFTATGATSQTVVVPRAGFATVVFPFTATTAVARGRLQVSATAGRAGDAVDKAVSVHPDGEEQHVTAAAILRDTASLEMRLPDTVLAGTEASTIRVYPDLLSHLVEGVEAALVRPHGCGEQIISSAYPSVLLLKHHRAAGTAGTAAARKAESYANAGLNRLLTYRSADGGFGYWGRNDDTDVALTAYAARFLSDAADVLPVDAAVVGGAATWLVSRQNSDGSWQPRYGDPEPLTASVAAALAQASKRLPEGPLRTKVIASVRAAMPLIRSARQPYSIAQLALAAWSTGLRDEAHFAIEKLKASAHHEGRRAYWVLETNTPFYAWGLAGRIESTAVAIQALQTIDGVAASTPLVDDGLAFLLSANDQYGIWYSGHATVDVLSTFFTALARTRPAPGGSSVVLTVNGQPGLSIDLPAGAAGGPVLKNVSSLLRPGINTIAITGSGGTAPYASVQIASSFYMPWTQGRGARETVLPGESRGLRLNVGFDKTSGHVGDEIRVSVEVERIGHRGYGMMLAEVGLPPGADVHRASLERALRGGNWDLCSYEVQPDRVVFYVWPRAGGTRFSFVFRPRFALRAQTAASTLYDYYNPDEQATVPPARFTILPVPQRTSAMK